MSYENYRLTEKERKAFKRRQEVQESKRDKLKDKAEDDKRKNGQKELSGFIIKQTERQVLSW